MSRTLFAAAAYAALLAFTGAARAEDMIGEDRTAGPSLTDEGAPEILEGTLKKARASGVLTIGYRAASFPFSHTKGGSVQGYSIDLCRGVAAEISRQLHGAPLTLAFEPVTSDNRIEAVASGKVDIECGSTTSNIERRKSVAFSPVIFVSGTKILVRRGSGIGSYRDLAGKNLVVTKGTTNEAALRALNDKYKLGISIAAGSDHGDSWDRFASGKADAFANDDVLLYGFIAGNKAGDKFAVAGDFITYDPYGLMFRRDDPQMAEAVRRAFAAMASTGDLAGAYRKWFLRPAPTGEMLNLPISAELAESFRAMGAEGF